MAERSIFVINFVKLKMVEDDYNSELGQSLVSFGVSCHTVNYSQENYFVDQLHYNGSDNNLVACFFCHFCVKTTRSYS